MPKPFKQLDTKIAWSCDWYHIRQDKIQLPDGSIGQYNIVEKSPAVWVLPITPDKQIVLVQQYRYTVNDICWELPAGSVKPGQTLEEAAREELHEEVGGTTEKPLIYGGQFYTANGITNEVSHYFLALDVMLSEPAHEPAESIKVHTKSIAEVLQMAHNHQITDGPSALILLLAESRLRAMIA